MTLREIAPLMAFNFGNKAIRLLLEKIIFIV